MVLSVGDVDLVPVPDCHPSGPHVVVRAELAVSGPLCTELPEELTAVTELLDADVVAVGDVDVALAIDGHCGGPAVAQLAVSAVWWAWRVRIGVTAVKGGHVAARRREL